VFFYIYTNKFEEKNVMGGLQSWSGHCREEKNLLPQLVVESWLSNPLPMPTELSQLSIIPTKEGIMPKAKGISHTQL
jgi:hypothetical protein